MMVQPRDLEAMFRPGVRYRLINPDAEDQEAVVEVCNAGRLHLATGRLVACDPFSASSLAQDTAAFTVTVPPGRYPVTLSSARIDRPTDPEIPAGLSLVAAARLTIRQEAVTRWELALRPGQDPAELPPGGFWAFYGFGVHSGAGAFLDLSALAELSRLGEPGPEVWQHRELEQVKPGLLADQMVDLVVDRAADLNVVIFLCAMGDGGYPVWIGRTAAGEPACFIADLELLSHHSSGPLPG
jgi:Protein of unknown function (DUF4241)